MGNLNSVCKKLSLLNVKATIAKEPNDLFGAEKLILPGVGHFENAINKLKSLRIYDTLNEVVLVKKVPILGICLGMQLMAKESEEGNAEGLGWIDTRVVRFKLRDQTRYKIPQIGWNTIEVCKDSMLLKNIENKSEFYFLHSYHCDRVDQKDILAKTEYEYEFVSAIEKDNIFGTQFHPEKSHQAGSQLLKNFIEL